MDTEIVDYNGQEFSSQAYLQDPDSVLFSMHGDSSSSISLEMGVANNFVSVVSGTLHNEISILI